MGASAVFYILGWLLTASAAAMLVPAAFAVALDPALVVGAFLFPAAVIGFAGVNMVIAFRAGEVVTGRRQNLLLLASVWIVMPLACAMPLYAAGFPGTLVAAFFEAISGFTTTGASVIGDLTIVPRSIIVWRGLLQWMGGLTTLLSLAVLLGPLWEGELMDRQFQFMRRAEQQLFRQIAEAMRAILPLYLLLTLLCFLSLLLSGLPAFDALCLALSTVSTGGFMPREGTIALYGSNLTELVLSIFMFLGAVSIVWVQALFLGRWTFLKEAQEPLLIAALIVLLGGALSVLMLQNGPITGLRDVIDALVLSIVTATSLISTTGFMVSEQTNAFIPYMVVLGIAIIGGGAYSTAGGLKVHRLWLMFRQIGYELRILIYPHGVRPSVRGDETHEGRLMMTIWTTFATFAFTIGALAIVLSATDIPIEGALLASASAVGNMGPAYELSRVVDFPDSPSFANMAPLSQIALCVGMILGRAEVLVLLGLFSIAFWRD